MIPGAYRRKGCGCSGLGSVFAVLLACTVIAGWPTFLDRVGAPAPAVITEKRESVRVVYNEWFRSFEITAAYSVPGQALSHHAVCDVDRATYDSLHRGTAVTVHYLPKLLIQPFIPAKHLSPCTLRGSIGENSSTGRLVVVFLSLLAILFLWRVLRIRSAVWLLLPWLAGVLAFVAMPRTEPAPLHPAPATAAIDRIVSVTMLTEDEGRERGIPLPHPYQIVLLRFVPPGMDTPVTAVDKIDQDSLPGLRAGQSVPILYDQADPRIASLVGGTRHFPGQARTTVLGIVAGLVLLAFLGAAFQALFARPRRSLPF